MCRNSDENVYFHQVIERIADQKPNKSAIVYMGKRITYKQLVGKFHRFASGLLKLDRKSVV